MSGQTFNNLREHFVSNGTYTDEVDALFVEISRLKSKCDRLIKHCGYTPKHQMGGLIDGDLDLELQ